MDVPAGLMALVFAASAPIEPVPYTRIAEALTRLGWREDGRRPISARAAEHAAKATIDLLANITMAPRGFLASPEVSDVAAELAAAAILTPP